MRHFTVSSFHNLKKNTTTWYTVGLHINLFYYLYLISSKLYRIILKNGGYQEEKLRIPRRSKIPDTCIVSYCFHFYTGQRAKIPDCPV